MEGRLILLHSVAMDNVLDMVHLTRTEKLRGMQELWEVLSGPEADVGHVPDVAVERMGWHLGEHQQRQPVLPGAGQLAVRGRHRGPG